MKIEILSENNDFVVVNKPHGVEFHGDRGLLSLLRDEFDELYGVHRLDKETSGLIIFAKNKQTQSKLSILFSEKKVAKTYLAISELRPKKKQGQVKGDIEKTRNGSYKLLRSSNNPSFTSFKSIYDEASKLRCFKLFPKTGKTHQLRVVMKSLGCPILGDERYKGAQYIRMCLHAYKIEFSLDSKEYCFESYPSDEIFKKVKASFEALN